MGPGTRSRGSRRSSPHRPRKAIAGPRHESGCEIEGALSEPAKMVWMDNHDLTIPTVPGAPAGARPTQAIPPVTPVARATQALPPVTTVAEPQEIAHAFSAPAPAPTAAERPEDPFGTQRQGATGGIRRR